MRAPARHGISPGSPQDLLLRTCTGSGKDPLERNLAGSAQEPVYARICNENAPDPELDASLRSRNAHGHVTRAVLRDNLHEKCRAQDGSRDRDPHFCASHKILFWQIKENSWRRLCASLRSRNAHGHGTRAIARENLQEKCWKPVGTPPIKHWP